MFDFERYTMQRQVESIREANPNPSNEFMLDYHRINTALITGPAVVTDYTYRSFMNKWGKGR